MSISGERMCTAVAGSEQRLRKQPMHRVMVANASLLPPDCSFAAHSDSVYANSSPNTPLLTISRRYASSLVPVLMALSTASAAARSTPGRSTPSTPSTLSAMVVRAFATQEWSCDGQWDGGRLRATQSIDYVLQAPEMFSLAPSKVAACAAMHKATMTAKKT